MNTKQLKSAAEELIEVLGLVDDVTKKEIVITKKTSDEEMIMLIKEAAGEITPEDDITEETRSTIDELLAKPKPAAKGKKVAEPEPEEEEEDVDLTEESLVEEIETAETIKQLKAIISNVIVFKEFSKKLNSIKDIDDLREEMLEIIGLSKGEDVEDEDYDIEKISDSEPKPKKSKIAPGNKETPAKKETKKEIAAKKEAPAKKETSAKKEKEVPVKNEKPVKEPKAPKVPKVKKERKPNRQSFVVAAINKLCVKGATLQQVMEYSDELYVQAGGESNPKATNVNTYTLLALVSFGILSKEKGVYKLIK
jgi:hypothetical protein